MQEECTSLEYWTTVGDTVEISPAGQLHIVANDAGAPDTCAYQDLADTPNTVEVIMRVCFDDIGPWGGDYCLAYYNGCWLRFHTDAIYKYNSGYSSVAGTALVAGTWYIIKWQINFVANTFSLWIDGVSKATDTAWTDNGGGENRFTFCAYDFNNDDSTEMHVDYVNIREV